MLSYEREAFYAKDDHEFRITFDQNILWRNYDLSLCKGIYGEAILDKNKVLMEVKTAGAIPLWMVHFLTETRFIKRHFPNMRPPTARFMRESREEAVHRKISLCLPEMRLCSRQ